ncbi:hypothetical protein BH753_gp115 [Bacillus phage Shbh1]|uniref:Uncharacterized protein n=1 Tax=Bacillus phage Shbh1 TaxID=1796992 RepID=A0A142F1E0_9CAUD|nr:hypothetical protein BH753_gp115 [Bacillus phage Shbh1]AMQ66597.1 hypothetical protein [Bacillus phage Shbh1]
MGRVRRPNLFKNESNTKQKMKQLGNTLSESTLNSTVSAIQKSKPKDMEIKRKPKYLEVTEKRLQKLGVIDLKSRFALSSKRTLKPKGGWYMRIPIRKQTRGMSRRMYDQLRSIDIAPDQRRTVVSNFLYDNRKQSEASLLNYQPKSYNIEKQRIGSKRHSYTVFRTVSDKSPVSSWIINRSKVNEKDTSKTFIRNVNRLVKWKMKNGWD